MVAPKNIVVPADSETYPLGEKSEHEVDGSAMALLALSHTAVEHRLYVAMLAATVANDGEAEPFTARRLMALTDIRSLSTIRRGLEGLVTKLSVTREPVRARSTDELGDGHENGNGNGREPVTAYRVHQPEEIFSRRQELGQRFSLSELAELHRAEKSDSFDRVLSKVVENSHLSRREAQVALCCVEGLTNAEIGERLQVSEQTVKFHLRHVFVKFGVKRRAELISRLLR